MAGAVEHITLDSEADAGAAPKDSAHRALLRRYAIPGHAGGAGTVLSLMEGHFLEVHAVGTRGESRCYQFDLRFADPLPVRLRRIPWAWMAVATCLAAAGLVALALAWPAFVSALGLGLTFGLVTMALGAVGIFVVLRWTRESLQFRSVHGRAVLASVTAQLGGTRHHQGVFAELSRAIAAARLARPQEKPHFLRDEMREHHRLRQLGVLSEQEYEACKAAILAAH
jgi:hypothetical protein